MKAPLYLSIWLLLPGAVGEGDAPKKNADRIFEILSASGICPQDRQTRTAPNSYLNKANPLPNTSETLTAGKKLYYKEAKPTPCRFCHGVRGNGNGELARNMEPPPRNFTCEQTMDTLPDGQLFWVIKNGSKGTKMPTHKKKLTDRQIWQLIRYIRQFGKH